MRRPAGSSSAAALAILFGVLVLMALVMDSSEKPGAPAIVVGRRMLAGADAGQTRTLEDFKADDPFQDSKRKGNRQVRKISRPSVAACIPRRGRFQFKEAGIFVEQRDGALQEGTNKNNIMVGLAGWWELYQAWQVYPSQDLA
ncbi:hypothetical protein E2562_018945 [Oryza meyeriana var. granulata]|uniref:Uncharacterized protein n=1 Tax=Oryza meyeriana var. granulata TaxID=110450 RepID=A0A6G1DKP5_9ORYZ|nr:hypothetical protein E2562_018945 [Oryza meyeriana var. granulata]